MASRDKRGRGRKKPRNSGVITTQVDMAAVYKNNQAEDNKLAAEVKMLKKKEHLEIVKCFRWVGEIQTCWESHPYGWYYLKGRVP